MTSDQEIRQRRFGDGDKHIREYCTQPGSIHQEYALGTMRCPGCASTLNLTYRAHDVDSYGKEVQVCKIVVRVVERPKQYGRWSTY